MLEEDMRWPSRWWCGDGSGRKSSMIQRTARASSTKTTKDHRLTLERQIIVNGEDVRLMLWDTAGQEEFDAITKAYYRGAQACVLVFSTTDRESFEAISSWREKVEMEVGDIPTVLVQNKIDLLDDTVIKNEEAEGLAKRLKLRFYRTSVKEDLNVNEGVFNTTGGSHPHQASGDLNGREVINLRPNKQRTKKTKNPFGSCRLL
ncbi:hypothetical protein cypCar_00020388 [Cyprinus carpio]|nr:hypothetical protein cypCar_00020388 [Cyprinus carpio]